MYGTSSAGISTPKSPRATIIPSATFKISSKLSIPSAFSIFAITGVYGAPHSRRSALISLIHSAFLTNDAAIKSTSCSAPKRMSSLSFSVIAGSLIGTFGTFTPFLCPNSPPLMISQIMSFSFLSTTFNSIRPSSIRTFPPISASSTSPLYVMLTRLLSPSISSVVRTNSSPSTS